jgi:predicted dehydrogenase
LTTSNIRVGLINTSWFAGMFHIPLTQSHEGADLVSICGRDKGNADEIAAQHGIKNVHTDYRTLVDSDDLDAVIVATPDDCHYEMTMYALRAGKHILCEKPMASTVAEAEEMTALAEQAAVVNMINFTWRWMPFYTYIRELIAEGTIGKLFYLNIDYKSSHGIEHQGWRFDADRAAGVLGDLGSHVIHVANLLAGEVAAVSANLQPYSAPQPDQAVPDNPANTSAALIMDFANGVQGTLHASAATYLGNRGQEQRVEIAGSEATLTGVMDMFNPDRIFLSRRDQDNVEELTVPDRLWGDVDRSIGRFDQNIDFFSKMPVGPRLFVDTILNDAKSEPSFRDGLHVQKVIDAALESDKTGHKIEIG